MLIPRAGIFPPKTNRAKFNLVHLIISRFPYSTYINTLHGVTARLRVHPVAQRELHVDQSLLACLVASRGLSSSSALLASVARYFGPFTTSGFTASKAALSSYTLGTPASSDC